MNKRQFRSNVRSTGIDEQSDAAIDELFDSIDLDGGGTLDLDELKKALSTLREASIDVDNEIVRLKKQATELWKFAKAAQLEHENRRKVEELVAQAKEERKVQEDADREAAAVEAAATRTKQAAAARKMKREEQDVYEQKLRQRRAEIKAQQNT